MNKHHYKGFIKCNFCNWITPRASNGYERLVAHIQMYHEEEFYKVINFVYEDILNKEERRELGLDDR
jgi:hypothetical protein